MKYFLFISILIIMIISFFVLQQMNYSKLLTDNIAVISYRLDNISIGNDRTARLGRLPNDFCTNFNESDKHFYHIAGGGSIFEIINWKEIRVVVFSTLDLQSIHSQQLLGRLTREEARNGIPHVRSKIWEYEIFEIKLVKTCHRGSKYILVTRKSPNGPI